MARMKNHLLFHRLLLIGLVLSLLLPSVGSVSAQTGNKVFISEIDCSAFPTISLLVRGLDESGNIISADLLANNFVVYENNQPVTNIKPIGSEEGPKYVVFSFDLGKNSNLDAFASQINDALNLFANEYFKENRDTVQIVTHSNPGSQRMDATPPTKNRAEFDSAIQNLTLNHSSNQLEGFLGINNLYNRLSSLDPGRSSMVIVHFGRLVEGIVPSKARADALALGDKLAAKNIRVYVLNTDFRGTSDAVQPFQVLTTQSGGEFVNFADNTARQSKLTEIFNQIKLNTQAYRIQFQAQQQNATYSVAPLGVSAADATDSQSCPAEIALPTPVVQITQPTGTNPTEFLKSGQTKIPVKATLQDWPRDGSRHITRVELLVDGMLADAKDFPADYTGTDFSLDMDVSQRQIVDSATFKLMVRAIDQFGTAGSAETDLTIFPYVQPTATSRPPAAVIAVSPACQENPFTPGCILEWVRGNLVWVFLIILIILLIVLIILFNTNRKLARIASPAREAISKGFDQVRKTLLGGASVRQEAIAYLNVLVAREDRTGGKIEIYNNRTSLGRDPKVTDVQLYHLDDESSVSSLHCTIFYEQGKFYITDDNSTNGTFVNGKRLDANQPMELPDGAEIILGDIYRQGAKLRFEIATPTGGEAEATPPVEEPDFHFDLESADLEPAAQEGADDYRKTVPGYRSDAGSSTEIFSEPSSAPSRSPASSSPSPTPPSQTPAVKPPPAIKRDKKDWKDELG